MIAAALYFPLYLFFLIILTIILSIRYSQYPESRLNAQFNVFPLISLILTIVMIIFIGFRPFSYLFADMSNYQEAYIPLQKLDFSFTWDHENYLFENILEFFAANEFEITYFFLFIASIYFIGILIATYKFFPKDTLYGLVIYLSAFSSFSYATNGIKAGAAAAIFLIAMAYWKNYIILVLCLFLSLGFHHSMVVPIVAFLCAKIYRNVNIYMILWIVCFFIAALHITTFQTIFAGLSDEKGASYLIDDGSGYRTGFRLDFVIYSVAPIVLGWYLMKIKGYRSDTYNFLFCLYILVNSVWLLCMYASFTNRIAYLSWFMMPIVLIYPFFDKKFEDNQYRNLNKVAWCNLGFTFIMQMIYYGGLLALL